MSQKKYVFDLKKFLSRLCSYSVDEIESSIRSQWFLDLDGVEIEVKECKVGDHEYTDYFCNNYVISLEWCREVE